MSTQAFDLPADAILQLIQDLPLELFQRHRSTVNALESICRKILTTPDVDKSMYLLYLDDHHQTNKTFIH